MQRVFISVLAALGILSAGCNQSKSPRPRSLEDQIPKHAQGKLATVRLWLGPAELNTEMALNLDQLRTGMMYRTNMDENDAMLFVFPSPFRVSFWMKNTVLPLSAAYVTPDGTIMEIHDLRPLDTNSVTAATENIQFVIETTQGWFARHNVSTGMVVRTERGPLLDNFHFQPNQ